MSKFDTKMTAVADEIRRIAKVSGSLTLDDMADKLEKVEVGGIDTSDATAEAAEIFEGETAYVNGERVTGSFTIDNELTTQDDLITQIQTAVRYKAMGDINIDEELATQDDLIAQIQVVLNSKFNNV